jgi:hypothetical protein
MTVMANKVKHRAGRELVRAAEAGACVSRAIVGAAVLRPGGPQPSAAAQGGDDRMVLAVRAFHEGVCVGTFAC